MKFQRKLLFNKSVGASSEKEHDRSRCQKCKELGYLCIRKDL